MAPYIHFCHVIRSIVVTIALSMDSIQNCENLNCVVCSMLVRLFPMCQWRKLCVTLSTMQWTMWLSILYWWVELLYATTSQYHNTGTSWLLHNYSATMAMVHYIILL